MRQSYGGEKRALTEKKDNVAGYSDCTAQRPER